MENPQQNQQSQNTASFTPGVGTKLKSFFVQCQRVWQILRKPTNEEFKSIAKISALGILAIGAIGFIIADIIVLFK